MSDTTLQKKAKSISLRLLVEIIIFLLSLFVFGWIADEMVLEKENRLDTIVFQKLAAITTPAVTSLMQTITFFGSNTFLFPAYLLLILYFLAVKKDRKLAIDITAIGITSTVVLYGLKTIFHRHRPLDPLVQNVLGFSFPSGHSFSSFTFFGLLIYILWKKNVNIVVRWLLSVLFFLFACTIAFSRVYLHVHFASDVVGGFLLCIVWMLLSFWILRRFNQDAAA